MLTRVSIEEFEDHLPEFIDRVVHHRERFVLTRGGKPVAELIPLFRGRRLSELPDIFAALPRLDAVEAESFCRDIEAARDELNAVPPILIGTIVRAPSSHPRIRFPPPSVVRFAERRSGAGSACPPPRRS